MGVGVNVLVAVGGMSVSVAITLAIVVGATDVVVVTVLGFVDEGTAHATSAIKINVRAQMPNSLDIPFAR
jgi:hypothetical protein